MNISLQKFWSSILKYFVVIIGKGTLMTNEEMMTIVYNQLAIDYNCNPDDFLKDEIIFTIAAKLPGRRAMPFINPRLEMVTFGRGVIVNVSSNLMPFVKKKLAGKSRYDVLNSKFVYGINPYFLPNVNNIKVIHINNYDFNLVDNDIQRYYKYENFHNALQYNTCSSRPEVLASVAKQNGKIVGIACVSADSDTMWQIGVDVLPEHRGKGIAVKLVNMLTVETLNRGVVPYYTTDNSNISSQRVAIKCGYSPVWSHCFKTRLPKIKSW